MKSVLVVVALGASCGGKTPPAPPPRTTPVDAPVATPHGPTIPDTPAGKTLRAWLDALASGDDAKMAAFDERYGKKPGPPLKLLREQGGEVSLLAIARSERLEIDFVVKATSLPNDVLARMTVADGDPARIVSLRIVLIPPGMTAADMHLDIDGPTRARVVDAIATQLTKSYVFPEVAAKMVAAVRERLAKGEYDALADSLAFADALTEHLRSVSHDRHLHVAYAPGAADEDHEPTADEKKQMREQLERINCGFQKAERLDGGIGYLKFDMFGDVAICGPKATAAFAALGAIDALIVDLRENGGGHPEMVTFVSSYLFDKKTHLNDIYDRVENKTTQGWTDPDVPGTKLAKQPVYVLTSQRTFSGAEDFAYGLKSVKRATIVGETTGGGAHPTMMKQLGDGFALGVPFARSINPITKTDWEGTGVEPDVKVAADQALETAKKLAAEKLAKRK